MNSESDIRIVQLKPSRVACYRAVSQSPEMDAINVVKDWAGEKGLMQEKSTRLFGFNNPGPKSGQVEYGYEVWLTVGPDEKASGNISFKDFEGGLYAVKRTNLAQIGQSWKDIIRWCKASEYDQSSKQCLEELLAPAEDISPESILIDLYLPIEKK
jgi:DNA gyrase inhibitor GyrI